MNDDPARPHSAVTRRTALTGLGAGALGLVAAGSTRPIAAQDDASDPLQSEDDVVYGKVSGEALLLNVVRPADRPAPRPAVVVIHFVDETSTPLIFLQAGNEEVIHHEQSRRMVAALQAAGVQVSYGWFSEYDHGSWFNWVPEAPETLSFFGRHLHPGD